jgi:hypothetical protein
MSKDPLGEQHKPKMSGVEAGDGDITHYIQVKVMMDVIESWKKCVICMGDNSADPGVDKICSACQGLLKKDRPLAFLHHNVLSIHKFYQQWRREHRWDRLERFDEDDHRGDSCFYIYRGNGEHLFAVPGDLIEIGLTKNDGTVEQRKLGSEETELLWQGILTEGQCHVFLIQFPELLRDIFLNDPASPVIKIEEISFEPRHSTCHFHWTYRLTLKDGRLFAVCFTDRQLGWVHIVRDFNEYRNERIKDFDLVFPLGKKRNCHIEIGPEDEEEDPNEELQEQEAIATSYTMADEYRLWKGKN